MKTPKIVLLVILAGAAAVSIAYGISVKNNMVGQLNGLKANVQDNEQKLSNVMMTIKKLSGVVKDSKEFQIEFTEEKMSARYGEEGVQGVMTWIQESSEPADMEAHKNLMNTIEAELKRFEAGQTTLIDRIKVAENLMAKFPSGQILRVLGYSHSEIEQYRVILSSEEASEAFRNGTFDVEVKL